jgi:hypothetical protein
MAQPPGYGNWLGILKWSLAQGSDGTHESSFRPMPEEVSDDAALSFVHVFLENRI